MKKKILLLLIMIALAVNAVYSEIPENEELKKLVNVMTDCLSATFVVSCNGSNINLPSSSVTINPETKLPVRVSFFLADPTEYLAVLEKRMSSEGGILSNILSIMAKTASDPFLTAVYLSIAAKGYSSSDYLLNGSIFFEYPQDATVQSLANIWLNRQLVKGEITLSIDLSIFGQAVLNPIGLFGKVKVFVDQENRVIVETGDSFFINDEKVEGLRFVF